MELFDSHAHYDDEKFNEDRDFIIKYSDIKLVFPPEKGDMIEFDSFLYQVS